MERAFANVFVGAVPTHVLPPGPVPDGKPGWLFSAPRAPTAVPCPSLPAPASPLCPLSGPGAGCSRVSCSLWGVGDVPPSKAQQGTIPVTAEDPFLLLPSRCHGVPVPTVSPLPRCPCCRGVPVPMAPVSGRGCFCAAGGNKAGSVTWPRSSAVPGSGRGRGEQLSDPKSSPSRGLTRVLHWEGEFIWPGPGAQGVGALHSHPWMGDFGGNSQGASGRGGLAGTFPRGRHPAAPRSCLPLSPPAVRLGSFPILLLLLLHPPCCPHPSSIPIPAPCPTCLYPIPALFHTCSFPVPAPSLQLFPPLPCSFPIPAPSL